MLLTPAVGHSMIGHRLVDDLHIPNRTFNLLFGALFLTILGTLLVGNIFLLDVEIFRNSALIMLPCLGLAVLFFAVSRRLGSLGWGLALTYGAFWLIAYFGMGALIFAFYGLCAVSLYDVARHLRLARRDWCLAVLMAMLGTATTLGVGRAFTFFDILSRAQADLLQKDTFFHASIAAMIKNYGVASTGLHGLVETPYHVLSHALMAAISRLSGISVLEVYGVAPWILFAPLLVFCIAACCSMLDRTEQLSPPLVWGSTAVVLSIVPFLFSAWALFDSYFISESYLVSLGLFVLGLGELSKLRLNRTDLVLVVGLSVLMANAKASVGLIYTGLWLTRLLWFHVPSWRMNLGAFLLSLFAVSWTVLASASSASGDLSFGFLSYIRLYSGWGKYITLAINQFSDGVFPSVQIILKSMISILSFFVIYFIIAWIYVARTVYWRGISGLFRAPLGVYVIASTGVGFLITLFADIPFGSAYFFSNVAMFVALPGVIAILSLAWQRSEVDERLAIASGFLIVCLVSLNAYYERSLLSPSSIQAKSARSSLVADLRGLRETTPLDWVLRPKAEWLASSPISDCVAQPFLFPAISERPWIGVISSAPEECNYMYYIYSQYGMIPGKRGVSVEPRLLPGMQIHDAGK